MLSYKSPAPSRSSFPFYGCGPRWPGRMLRLSSASLSGILAELSGFARG